MVDWSALIHGAMHEIEKQEAEFTEVYNQELLQGRENGMGSKVAEKPGKRKTEFPLNSKAKAVHDLGERHSG